MCFLFKMFILQEDQILLTYFVFLLLSGLVKLWSALTLLGSYQNRRCAFRVLQVEPCGGWTPPPAASSCAEALWLAGPFCRERA